MAPVTNAQATIHVPGDQPTIQAGINAAANGDTVLVAPGIYVEKIDFMGKAITVTSSAGPATTTIDGGQSGVVVNFNSNETRASVINGFTITDDAPPLPTSVTFVADGISVGNAAPTISNNVITKNRGYGIQLSSGGSLISGNTISYTVTQYNPQFDYGCDYDDGSAIYVNGVSPNPSQLTTISNNVIENNTAQCEGGGIQLDEVGNLTILNNTIRYNVAKGGGGAINMFNGNQLAIIQNLIYGNTAGTAGGAIYLGAISEANQNTGPVNLFIVSNTIVGNTISPNPDIADAWTDGSQIALGGYVSQSGLFNNIIVAGDSWGAIACDPSYQYLSGTPLVTSHNDIINFSGLNFGGWCTDPTGSAGNISANPEFLAAGAEVFRLQGNSPAAASGNVGAPNLPATDIDGNQRIMGGMIDMGVYEGVYTSGNNPPPSFSIASTTTGLTVQAGQSETATLTVTPTGGFIGTVSFACSGLPASVACYFSPPILAEGGDNSVLTTTVTVSVSAAAASLGHAMGAPSGPASLFGAASLIFVALVVAGTRQRAYRWADCALLELIVLVVLIGGAACGGGAGTGTQPPPPTTPTSVVITATGAGNVVTTTHNLNLALTITQ